jgi:hypothetical protein
MQLTAGPAPGCAIKDRKDMGVTCLCAQGMEKPFHGSSPQAWMKRGEVFSVEAVFLSIGPDKIRPETIKILFKKVLVLLQIFSALAQGTSDAGVKIALEKRKQYVPDPVAQKPGIIIGGIAAKGDFMPVKIVQELFFGRLQEGANDVAVFKRHAADSLAARAAQKPVQHLLGLVIGCMTDRDQCRALLPGTGTHAGIAQIPGRVLKAQAVFMHAGRGINLKTEKRHGKKPGQSAYRFCLLLCLIRTQAMIDMGADKVTGQNRPQPGKDMQQGC